MKKSIAMLAAGLLAIPCLTQATIITITAEGTIFDSHDENGTLFNQGAGNGVLNGKTAKISLFYDTSNVPPSNLSWPGAIVYANATHWMDSAAWIDGVEYNFVTGAGTASNNDYLELHDNDYGYDALSIHDMAHSFSLVSNNQGSVAYTQIDDNSLWTNYLTINFLSSLSPSLSSVVVQNANSTGVIYPIVNEYVCASNVCGYTVYKQGYAKFSFDTFTIAQGDAPVPEPTTIALLGMGLAGLGAARRRKA